VTLEVGYSSRVSNEASAFQRHVPQQQERHGRRLSFYGFAEPHTIAGNGSNNCPKLSRPFRVHKQKVASDTAKGAWLDRKKIISSKL